MRSSARSRAAAVSAASAVARRADRAGAPPGLLDRGRRCSRGAGPPRRRGPLRGPFRGFVDERRHARLQRRGQLGARPGPAADRRGEPVPEPAHPVLQGAQQLPGADELLPARQDLPAQQRAVAHALVDLGDRAHVRGVGIG